MKKEFHLLVFIGRFQPFHREHKRVIDTALAKSENVLVLIGSAGAARTVRNPFTYAERKSMIFNTYYDGDHTNVVDRLYFAPLYDKMYNDTAWIEQVQETVRNNALDILNNKGFRLHGLNDFRIGLIGGSKDKTSYYLNMFPQWGSVDVPIHTPIHATDIRKQFFNNTLNAKDLIPLATADFMFSFQKTGLFDHLAAELEHVENYKKAWEVAPYPVKHVTVDAVVEQSGHVLLVKRRAAPGKGLWAIPGGHLEMDETMLDGAIRELREETKLKVPEPVLKGSIVRQHIFDNPHRSQIGRVITNAFHIKLPNGELPKVKGSDDAEKAKWVPICDVKEDMLFDDHYHIIHYFLGVY